MAPPLMAAMGTSRERFESASSLESSLRGESTVVLCRHCAGKGSQWKKRFPPGVSEVLRQTFHEWAACPIPLCDWARAYYDQLKARGKSHHMAVRALAFKWMRILYRCWKHREIYREDVYLASLAKRSLPFQTLAASVQIQ